MLVKKTGLLFTTALIFLAACKKNSSDETVVFETTSTDQAWTSSGVMAGGRELENVVIDVPQLTTVNYTNLTVEESYSGSVWEEVPAMDLGIAISSNSARNIYTVDASRGRTIRVYNFRRRAALVSIRIRAHRR